jgi:hypothetical protein
MMEKDDDLRKLIKSAGVEEPGKNFTIQVMEKIRLMEIPETVEAPIISRKAWIITGLVSVVLVFIILSSDGFVSGTTYDILNKLSFTVPEFKSFQEIVFNSSLIPMLIICSALLLLADYFFSYRTRWSR